MTLPENRKPLLWKDMPFSERPKAHPSTERLEIEKLQERVAELEAVLDEVDGRLTNLQPIIANGLLNELQLSVIDNNIDPCISIIRAALIEKTNPGNG